VGTLGERTTLYVDLMKLENGKADTDAEMRCSMTYDQGREMARRRELSEQKGLKIDFAHRIARGNAASTKIPTACCTNIYPKGKTSATTRRTNSTI
jgi:gentisate 1,2-dioxygenase